MNYSNVVRLFGKSPSRPAPRYARFALIRTSLVLGVALLLLAGVGTVFAGFAQVKIDQCSNNNNVLGECVWINGIINANNSIYREGMSSPQRGLWVGVTGGLTHTIEFDMQWSKAGIHGYDWLTSYAQAQATAQALGVFTLTLNECADQGGLAADCASTLDPGGFFIDIEVPDDPYVSKDGPAQPRIDAFEALYGNRTIRLRADQPITAASLSLIHEVADGADTGDSYVHYTLVFTSSAQTVLLQAAGHIARSLGPTGWGTDLGAAAISGGPWHFKTFKFDGTGGSQDNQITMALPTAMKLTSLTASAVANNALFLIVLLVIGAGAVVIVWKRTAARRQVEVVEELPE